MKTNPEMKKACDLICDKLLTKYSLDIVLVPGGPPMTNIMKRGNVLVITDPVEIYMHS